jgi:hypothetical protein
LVFWTKKNLATPEQMTDLVFFHCQAFHSAQQCGQATPQRDARLGRPRNAEEKLKKFGRKFCTQIVAFNGSGSLQNNIYKFRFDHFELRP